MTIYIANWATGMEREALRDDGGMDLDDLASPRGVVLMDRDDATIKALLAMAWDEAVLDGWEDGDGPKPDPHWLTDGWVEQIAPRSGYQHWFEPDQELMVIMSGANVVQPDKGPL